MAFSSVLIRHQVTLTVAQPIVKPRRRHRALPHRDADLIEPRDDIAGGVKTGKKPVEEGPERQTTLVIGKRAQRVRKLAARARSEGRIENVEASRGRLAAHLDGDVACGRRERVGEGTRVTGG